MSVAPYQAVLFDLDGTLLDTAPDLAGAINDMRLERGLAPMPLAELAPLCSFGGRGMLGKGLDLRPEDDDYSAAYDAFIETYRGRMTRDTRAYDGMRELVRELTEAGCAWGVITNKMEALALPLMTHMAFDPAPACVIGDAGRVRQVLLNLLSNLLGRGGGGRRHRASTLHFAQRGGVHRAGAS